MYCTLNADVRQCTPKRCLLFALYQMGVSYHCRLCVVSVLGSDKEEISLCARCPHEGSGSTV